MRTYPTEDVFLFWKIDPEWANRRDERRRLDRYRRYKLYVIGFRIKRNSRKGMKCPADSFTFEVEE